MKQNPTNSIKAGYRVELRAKNHIKITSDNLMSWAKHRHNLVKSKLFRKLFRKTFFVSEFKRANSTNADSPFFHSAASIMDAS